MEDVDVLIDSGAVFFYNKIVKGSTIGAPGRRFKDRIREDHSYSESPEFKKYRNAYVRFLKKNDNHISSYVNLDIINNAEASYESLKYLESKGLHPLPVFHVGNDTKWLRKYIEEGYELICLGGITPNPWKEVRPILDKIWSEILTDKDGMPIVKVHGLAATSYNLMKTYPWYSCDSASWLKAGIYGSILLPKKRKGVFRMDIAPYSLPVSVHQTKVDIENEHALPTDKRKNRKLPRLALEWLNEIGVPVGSVDEKGNMIEWGILSNWEARCLANLKYFKRFVQSLPPWPWPFKLQQQKITLFE